MEVDSESDEKERIDIPGFTNERKPYHQRFYMLFGNDAELPFIDLNGTFSYLSAMKANRNTLKQARNSKKIAELVEATF